ncbi:hypothetical protein CAPTEDRAFT_151340 [Capitella teleta]|uniref:MYND-type domain-containing protein n=1 Tax=Capitella teleta TaxID=283909 RepID=R7U907_CAPTE|nr:hypothetical protein CAPTEDRAFT_151340 [Capitella teleta]|eukprot:ELU00182.1 hypothetical protein CAPTEDRAFT_151340 [Capitella teleta]
MEAAQNGNLEEVQRCISIPGVRVDCLDEHGMTPLQHAAYKGRPDIARILLNQGADVNDRNHEHGYTALMFAAISGNTEATRLMLEAGGSTSHVNSVGRTAAQMAGFVGQSQNSSMINNFFSKEDLDEYTVIRGHEKEPKLPGHLVQPLHTLILHSNLHPVFISMYLQEHSDLMADVTKIVRLLDLLCEKMMKQKATNEVMAMKFHYLSAILKQCEKCWKSAGNLNAWIKSLVKGRDEDGFAEQQEKLIRASVRDFPYIESQLMQQMVRSIAPVKIGQSPTALNILSSAVNGQKFATDDESCCTCGQLHAEKKCSVCKMVKYCDQKCQKLHWSTHKKFCKELADDYVKMMKRLKEEQEKEERKKKENEKEKEKTEELTKKLEKIAISPAEG